MKVTILPAEMWTYYVLFPFGARHEIGVDTLNMSRKWVEVKSRQRSRALSIIENRFGPEGWTLVRDDGFTPESRAHYPDGCCLILIDASV